LRGRGSRIGIALLCAAAACGIFAATVLGFGLFRKGDPVPTGGISYAVAIGDLNRDGKSDVVASNGEGTDDHVSFLRGNGDGTFRKEIRLTAGSDPDGVAVGDLNRDGRKDIVAANYGDDTLSIFLKQTNGKFSLAGTPAAGPGSWQVAITDLNRDGKRDLVTANYGSTGPDTVSVLLGRGNGSFRPHHDFAASAEGYGLVIGRMNRDRRPDVVVIDSDGNPSVLLAKQNGTLSGPITKTVPAGSGDSYDPAIGDFNRDGKLDVAVADYSNNRVQVLHGLGNGHLKDPQMVPTDDLGPNAVAARDFNRDGKLDLAVGYYSAQYGLGIIFGKGKGGFGNRDYYSGTDRADVITAGRLNSDKGPDLVIGTPSGIEPFLNRR
jgi:hypothetical protein